MYLNDTCPVCKKHITPYSYKIIKGVKYHLDCEPYGKKTKRKRPGWEHPFDDSR